MRVRPNTRKTDQPVRRRARGRTKCNKINRAAKVFELKTSLQCIAMHALCAI